MNESANKSGDNCSIMLSVGDVGKSLNAMINIEPPTSVLSIYGQLVISSVLTNYNQDGKEIHLKQVHYFVTYQSID